MTERFLPQYAAAGAEAARQRYGLQADDLSRENEFNRAVSEREFLANWAPFEYLLNLWGSTGGAKSEGESGGWNFGISPSPPGPG